VEQVIGRHAAAACREERARSSAMKRSRLARSGCYPITARMTVTLEIFADYV
jgi:hypothetical protein